jgi:hypothetical protein
LIPRKAKLDEASAQISLQDFKQPIKVRADIIAVRTDRSAVHVVEVLQKVFQSDQSGMRFSSKSVIGSPLCFLAHLRRGVVRSSDLSALKACIMPMRASIRSPLHSTTKGNALAAWSIAPGDGASSRTAL